MSRSGSRNRSGNRSGSRGGSRSGSWGGSQSQRRSQTMSRSRSRSQSLSRNQSRIRSLSRSRIRSRIRGVGEQFNPIVDLIDIIKISTHPSRSCQLCQRRVVCVLVCQRRTTQQSCYSVHHWRFLCPPSTPIAHKL